MVASVWPVPDWNSAESYHIGMKRFGANRPGGRLHAGCDLYAPVGSEVLAIGPGKIVVAGLFYDKADEVQIEHDGIGLVRYAEILLAPGISAGISIPAGQVLGTIKRMPSVSATMLHIELYENTDPLLKGKSLTPKKELRTIEASGPYIRRGDLKDITPLLDSLRHYYKPKRKS